MEQKQISCDPVVYDRLPPLSSKDLWFVAQKFEEKDEDEQIFYTIHNPLSEYKCRIPELNGRRIQACYHGWVILSNHPDMVMWSLWNPITSELICLPPLTHEKDIFYECCLSSPPVDPSSILLLIPDRKATILFCRLDRKRKNLVWTEISYADQLKHLKSMQAIEEAPEEYGFPKDDGFVERYGFLNSPACCNSKVYVLTTGFYYHFLIQVDIVVKDNEDVISLLPIAEIPSPCFNRCRPSFRDWTDNFYMKGFSTELFYIDIGFEDETGKTVFDVFLFKLDMTNMTWEEMKDLKGAMFVTNESVFYRPDISSELDGYIHILDDIRKVIYLYNVKRKTILRSPMPCLVQSSQVSAWAMLECRLPDHNDSKQQGSDTDDKTVARSVASDKVEFYKTTDESSHLFNIPLDVLEIIMDQCVGVAYMNFRATCKRCHLAVPPIPRSNKPTLKKLQTYPPNSPWLMVLDKHRGIITFKDP